MKYGSEKKAFVREVNVQRIDPDHISLEGVFDSADILLHSDGREREVGRMVIKSQGEERMFLLPFYQTWPEVLLEKHAWLRSRGFPVVPTFRANVVNNRILMTDVTKNGRKKIIDKHYPLGNNQVLVNKQEINSGARAIAQAAYDGGNGVFLYQDAYAVVVDESGTGKLALLDLGMHTFRMRNGMTLDLYYDNFPLSLEDALEQVDFFFQAAKIFPRKGLEPIG